MQRGHIIKSTYGDTREISELNSPRKNPDCNRKMAHVIPTGHGPDRAAVNKEVINRLQDFLNNPDTKYVPSEIWHKDYIELRPWPFQTGTGREGVFHPL